MHAQKGTRMQHEHSMQRTKRVQVRWNDRNEEVGALNIDEIVECDGLQVRRKVWVAGLKATVVDLERCLGRNNNERDGKAHICEGQR
eukprot:5404845-Pleurochrysis_carterae.AAC.3